MKVLIEKYPICIWHTDCNESEYGSGPVKDFRSVGEKTPIKCMCCGEEGVILQGAHFGVEFFAEDPLS